MTSRTPTISQVRDAAGPGCLEALLIAQRDANTREGIPDARTRIDRVSRLQALLLDNARAVAAAAAEDFGVRPEELTISGEILTTVEELEHQKKHVAQWMRPQRGGRLWRVAGLHRDVHYAPKGVVGVLGPWNFPIQLSMLPAGTALAAGNRVLVRPSSVTAHTAEVLAELATRYFPADELAVVTSAFAGGAAFTKLNVDHLFFTGSTEVGAAVAAQAGANLTPVTLELGGKNPAVIDESADIAAAARRIADTRLINSGQVCLCPDYAYVPEAHVETFVAAVLDRWRSTVGNSLNNPQFTSIINDDNFDRILGLIDDAVGKGAIRHSAVEGPDSARARRAIAPVVLTDVTDVMEIDRTEIFGPVLVVYPYRTLSSPIAHINRGGEPLTIYWYGERNERFEMLMATTRSGSVNANDFGWNMTGGLPFGGVGRSGMGNYHGHYGFRTFSHERAVAFSALPVSPSAILSPPYTRSDTLLARAQLLRWRRRVTRR